MSEYFQRKMSENVSGNRKMFQKDVVNVKGEKVQNCNRIKDRPGKLAMVGDTRETWKQYSEDLYNVGGEGTNSSRKVASRRKVLDGVKWFINARI